MALAPSVARSDFLNLAAAALRSLSSVMVVPCVSPQPLGFLRSMNLMPASSNARTRRLGGVAYVLPRGGRPIFRAGRLGCSAFRFFSLSQLSILRRAAPATTALVPVNLDTVALPSGLSGK